MKELVLRKTQNKNTSGIGHAPDSLIRFVIIKPLCLYMLYMCEAVVVIESGHSHTDEHHGGLSCEQRLLSSMAFCICEAVSPGLSIA